MNYRMLGIGILFLVSLLLSPPLVVAHPHPTPTLTKQQVANRARKARLKTEEKAKAAQAKLDQQKKRQARLARQKALHEKESVRAYLPKQSSHKTSSETIRLRITSLDYSCWRNQSDSASPVYIHKHKPAVDMKAKLDRCFVNKPGYDDADFLVSFTRIDTSQSHHVTIAETDRTSWEGLRAGSCYTATQTHQADTEKELSKFTPVPC